jgi:UDP-2,4-diacetamido-2,4,6-trideoxy-beta-L-altropyranose hydrolase
MLGGSADIAEDTADAAARLALFKDADLIVVDDYDIDRDGESALKATGARLVAFEDRPIRTHAADILLDPTPGRTKEFYGTFVPAACTLLLGPDYALLRDEFRAARLGGQAAHARQKPSVLVSMGGTDPNNATAGIMDRLITLAASFDLVVVLGRHAPHHDDIAGRITRWKGSARLAIDPESMAGLLTTVDLAIGAPGVSASERACMGLPQILVHTADNQTDIAAALACEGAAVDLGPIERLPAERLAQQVQVLLQDTGQRTAMSNAARTLFDGDGSARVAAILSSGAVARDGTPILLRRLKLADEGITYAWQCDSQTRKFARNAQIPAREEHAEWIARRVADVEAVSEILLCRGVPAGIVRLDKRLSGQFEVSIVIAPAFRQMGIGYAALSLVRNLRPKALLLAHILPENIASQSLFERAGYIEQGEGNWLCGPQSAGGEARVQ